MDDFLEYFGLNFTQQKRDKIFAEPFPQQWEKILKQRFSLFDKMPATLQEQLKKHIQIFFVEKEFIGENILITEEVKVVIAAQACLLLLNRKTNYFRGLERIVVVPSAFMYYGVQVAGLSGIGEVTVSWDDTLDSAYNAIDGYNVVIHEFAHQLDLESGANDCKPLLEEHENLRSWSSIMSEELKKLKFYHNKGFPTLIREYGATNESEFFAVATEVFFEQSTQMWEQHPDLYSQLMHLYQVDPKSWQYTEELIIGQLELHFEMRKMNFGITTILNKRSVILFADNINKKIWDNHHQLTLLKEGNQWFVLHNKKAVNETLLNNKAVKIKAKLKNGDILAIGRELTKVVRMPMLVKIV